VPESFRFSVKLPKVITTRPAWWAEPPRWSAF
jgi:uncharacterized protein YecE (DUF72 family)